MAMTLRREEPSDYGAVEQLTRDAFWGLSGPRCDEHLLVHRLRDIDAFVPELDVVAVIDGIVVGNVMYSRARVVADRRAWDVLTFGPLSIAPRYQGRGVGGALMRHTLADATRLGHRAAVVYGHPDYYPRFGFVRGSQVGITSPGGASPDALMALALIDGGLDGVRGEFLEDPVFHLDPAEAEAFDDTFSAKEPATLTSIDVLGGHAPAGVVEALHSCGIDDLQTLRRHSSAELTATAGIGRVGCDAIRDYLRQRGIAWGAPR